jgi:hypothetical protein
MRLRLISHGGLLLIILSVCALVGAILLLRPEFAGSSAAQGPGVPGSYSHLSYVGSVAVRSLPDAVPTQSGAAPNREGRSVSTTGVALPQANVIDSAALSQPPQAAPGFAGVKYGDENAASVPPDVQLAVGPQQIVEMVNTAGRVFDRQGQTIKDFALRDLFQVPQGADDFDPKVIYDPTSQRFFAAYVSTPAGSASTGESHLHIAVSTSSDPGGDWKAWAFPYQDVFPDYPGIGLTDDKLIVSANVTPLGEPGVSALAVDGCTTDFCGVQTLVIEKADVVGGAASPAVFTTARDPNYFTVRPAQSLTSTNNGSMASFETSGNQLHLWTVTGRPVNGDVVVSVAADLTVKDRVGPCILGGGGQACAANQDSNVPVDSGDSRALEAVWRDGRLWIASETACDVPGDNVPRACVALAEVDTGNKTVLQDIVYGGVGAYYYFPAIRTDQSGNLHVVFSRSSTSEFVQVRIAVRALGDAANTLSQSALVKAGDAAYNPSADVDSKNPRRWGDYYGAALDPSDASVVWFAGEYAAVGGLWGTWITSTSSGPAGTPTPTPPGSFVSGNVNCLDGVDPEDSLALLVFASTPHTAHTSSACPAIGSPFGAFDWGDVNCDGVVDAKDALADLLHFAALTPHQETGCTPIGDPISVTS